MRRIIVCLALPLALIGCATVDNVKVAAAKIAEAARQHAEAVYQRQQKYFAEHDVLKNFEDAGEHSEVEVLKVLRAARDKSAAPHAAAPNAPAPKVAGAPMVPRHA